MEASVLGHGGRKGEEQTRVVPNLNALIYLDRSGERLVGESGDQPDDDVTGAT